MSDPAAPAVVGGRPVREARLPYGRQSIDDEDVQAVVEALRSDWLTTGPRVEELERAFARRVGALAAVALSSGTAALHAAMHALRIGPGDEVLVPAMTFAASANAAVYMGARPVFVDVEPRGLLIDPADVERKLGPRTRAVVAVDYAGHPCDYDALAPLLQGRRIPVIADACHAVGGEYRGRPVGGLADLSTFSLHPVKHFTSGEGGLVSTDDAALADRMRAFRNHGITTDHRQRTERRSHFYEMVELGYNYRLTDFQCALGLSQLRRLNQFVERRRVLAARYRHALADMPWLRPLPESPHVRHAYHLFVVQLELDQLTQGRDRIFAALQDEGIGVNVHYIPVHLHPFYRERFGTGPGLCPVAEAAYERLLTLPLFPAMSDSDVEDVVAALRKVLRHFSR